MIGFITCSLLLTTCMRAPQPEDKVIARLGDMVLTESELESWEAAITDQEVTAEMRETFIQNWLEEAIMIYEARNRNLDEDPWVVAKGEELRQRLMVARLWEKEKANIPPPSSAEIAQYYQSHLEEFKWREKTLVVEKFSSGSASPLEKLQKELRASPRPSPLPSLLADVVVETLIVSAGSEVNPTVWKALERIAPGQFTSIFQDKIIGLTAGGAPLLRFSCYRLLARYEEGSPQPLESVSERIRIRLMAMKEENHRRELLDKLHQQYLREGRLYLRKGAVKS